MEVVSSTIILYNILHVHEVPSFLISRILINLHFLPANVTTKTYIPNFPLIVCMYLAHHHHHRTHTHTTPFSSVMKFPILSNSINIADLACSHLWYWDEFFWKHSLSPSSTLSLSRLFRVTRVLVEYSDMKYSKFCCWITTSTHTYYNREGRNNYHHRHIHFPPTYISHTPTSSLLYCSGRSRAYENIFLWSMEKKYSSVGKKVVKDTRKYNIHTWVS